MKDNIDFIIVGDKKSPSKFLLKGANYFSLQKQKSLKFKLSKIKSEKHTDLDEEINNIFK